MEQRAAVIEVRAAGRRLEGWAALFGVEASVSDPARGTFRERIRPGAFAASIGGDVLALRDHDPRRVLGRTTSGTLRLREEARGLAFELDVPDTSEGRDTLVMAERGDLGGCSIGFTVNPGGEEWRGDLRELRTVSLAEISIVSAWPAYRGTVVQCRSGLYEPRQRLSAARLWLNTVGT
ncbi:MAG: HK97 family phage prohead protease [Methylobacterium sp.]|uniref:HK97 family phage prohead protease n=1 Tax=Methylobacterium sp. TaxID=409 RepID=UPI002582FEE5|nr:HK97 family phage prohead protease [Methylobacterium sp.]MBY0298559.1 HK97 family phage prohead protease [Methylobacterium sp.]